MNVAAQLEKAGYTDRQGRSAGRAKTGEGKRQSLRYRLAAQNWGSLRGPTTNHTYLRNTMREIRVLVRLQVDECEPDAKI